jgi:3'-phosphoadenosine 5'-phosphosulfate sulfotransferase (PAPS reductase)/FAD synthetase
MIHAISLGGGLNSTAMTLLLLEQKKPIDYILFADTGEEKPETYQFIKIFDKYLKDKHSLSITVVSQIVDGKPQTLSEYCQQHDRQRTF